MNPYKVVFIFFIIVAIFVIGLFFFQEKPVDYNCSNFKSYSEALRVFKKNAIDVYHLDTNHNGIPCEMLVLK